MAVKAREVHVDGRSRRSDHDALEGGFVTIEKGKYAGRTAVYEKTLSFGPEKGFPLEIQVRTRDKDSLVLKLPYTDVAAKFDYNGGR